MDLDGKLCVRRVSVSALSGKFICEDFYENLCVDLNGTLCVGFPRKLYAWI